MFIGNVFNSCGSKLYVTFENYVRWRLACLFMSMLLEIVVDTHSDVIGMVLVPGLRRMLNRQDDGLMDVHGYQ